MAAFDLETLTAPIEEGEPCGPDLDAEDDDAYIGFMTSTEMVLPEDYMVADNDGKRVPFHSYERFKDLDLGVRIATGSRLLGRTHDLRLLGLIARLSILNRALGDFSTIVGAMAALCESFWVEVHPRAEGESYGLRIGALERLDELLTIAALNNAPLFRSRRHGVMSWLTYRAVLRQTGGDRQEVDTTSLDRMLAEESQADASQIIASQTALDQLRQALSRLRTICGQHVKAGPPNLSRLIEAVAQLCRMLDRINPPEGGAEAVDEAFGGQATEAATLSGVPVERTASGGAALFKTAGEAAGALDAATTYFSETEPSSPALLLLRQAQALVGKSFIEALESLLPDQVGRASLKLGSTFSFKLPLAQLAERGSRPSEDAAEPSEDDRPPPYPRVMSRSEAVLVLDQVGAFYRSTEPSSPIPLLIERTRALVGRDFMALLGTMLPEDSS